MQVLINISDLQAQVHQELAAQEGRVIKEMPDIGRGGYCLEASQIGFRLLREAGVQRVRYELHVLDKHKGVADIHAFLSIDPDLAFGSETLGPDDIIIDMTYLQFIDPATIAGSGLAQTYFGTRFNMQKLLEEHATNPSTVKQFYDEATDWRFLTDATRLLVQQQLPSAVPTPELIPNC